MLKTNSKKARENIRKYILDHVDTSNYEEALDFGGNFTACARWILGTFRSEKYYSDNYCVLHKIPEQDSFMDWCAGLPSALDTCYYYNRSAVDDLGAILEETESEKRRFSENDAEDMLSRLIYRELIKEA